MKQIDINQQLTMPQRHIMFEIKGILATVTTFVTGVISWLPEVESLLRITLSAIGIYATYYMARYWQVKIKLALEKKQQNNNTE